MGHTNKWKIWVSSLNIIYYFMFMTFFPVVILFYLIYTLIISIKYKTAKRYYIVFFNDQCIIKYFKITTKCLENKNINVNVHIYWNAERNWKKIHEGIKVSGYTRYFRCCTDWRYTATIINLQIYARVYTYIYINYTHMHI